jgi:DNA-binding SARP family transcriptional activator
VEFRILGPLEVVDGDRPITLAGARTRALLALLLTSANEIVSSDRLIDELWGSRPPRTAANALQYHVSRLRKVLAPADVIVTRGPGYLVAVHPDELDLLRFERLVAEARGAPPDGVARLLREALALWRGPPLADLEREPFARAEIRRLEELRLLALEQRIEADLALGRHAEIVAELEALAREHPYREPLRAQLMRALYGAGRQADALEVYRSTRRLLVDELGIEPGPAIQQLEQAILRQDPALDSSPAVIGEAPPERGTIVVALLEGDNADGPVAIAEALAREPRRELIVARFVESPNRLAAATAELAETQKALEARSVASRVAAYTTSEPGAEAVLLTTQYDSELLLLVDSSGGFGRGELPDYLRTVLDETPCDVGLLAGAAAPAVSGPIVAPFGGSEHDWSAIEIAAWLAGALGTNLRLVGTQADGARGRRDASRLLARASLLVQQVVGITTEPALVPPGPGGVLEAAADSRLLVVGLSSRWRAEGLGASRVALASGDVPTLFVRRGPRPGGLAPSETLTRFTWTLGAT